MGVIGPVLPGCPLFERLKLDLWQAPVHIIGVHQKRLGRAIFIIMIEGRDEVAHRLFFILLHGITEGVD